MCIAKTLYMLIRMKAFTNIYRHQLVCVCKDSTNPSSIILQKKFNGMVEGMCFRNEQLKEKKKLPREQLHCESEL